MAGIRAWDTPGGWPDFGQFFPRLVTTLLDSLVRSFNPLIQIPQSSQTSVVVDKNTREEMKNKSRLLYMTLPPQNTET